MEGEIMTAVQTSNPVHDAEGAVEAGIHEVGATIDAVEREVGRGVSTRFPLNSAFIFTFGALGGMLFGFDTGIISGASPLIESDFGLSVAQTGFITSSVLIGSCAGALSIGALSDRFGRKKLLILAAILFLLGSGMCAGSTGFLMMVVARIILGLAVGAPLADSGISCRACAEGTSWIAVHAIPADDHFRHPAGIRVQSRLPRPQYRRHPRLAVDAGVGAQAGGLAADRRPCCRNRRDIW